MVDPDPTGPTAGSKCRPAKRPAVPPPKRPRQKRRRTPSGARADRPHRHPHLLAPSPRVGGRDSAPAAVKQLYQRLARPGTLAGRRSDSDGRGLSARRRARDAQEPVPRCAADPDPAGPTERSKRRPAKRPTALPSLKTTKNPILRARGSTSSAPTPPRPLPASWREELPGHCR